MEAYRAIDCQNCGRDDGTVAGAHSNWKSDHKGMGIKASDDRCASLCSRCHTMLDQGFSMNAVEKKIMWEQAHVKTVTKLVQLGLWPKNVQVPNLDYK